MGSLFSSSSRSSLAGVASDAVAGPAPSPSEAYTVVEQRCEVETNDSPRFEYNDPALAQFMEEHGYAIVKGVASPEEVDRAQDLLWEFLESEKIGMKRSNPKTWTNLNFQRVGMKNNGILAFNGIQQSNFLWFVRLLPKVKGAFETIFGTGDLITSFDGGNIFRPWHSSGSEENSKTECGWWHVDQGITMRGRHAIQGLVTLHDCTAETGGFCVIPGSHRSHDALMDICEERSKSVKNFIYIPPSFPALQERQILPICKAGDLVLWDSRTIHCNTPSLVHPSICSHPADQLLRAAGYVCMNPTSMATPEVLAKRQLIFELGDGTTHWPHLIPYDIDADREAVANIEEVSTLQRQLIIGGM
jgi:hypothetical protein